MGKVQVETDIPQTVNYVATTVNIGTTETLPAGSDATVSNSGTESNAIFNFGIPRGTDGEDGKSAYEQAVEGGYEGTEEEFEQALASDIATVADNISDINAVGQSITDVNAVADTLSDVSIVANIATEVSTVSGISADVAQVSGIASAVSNVSDNDDAVLLVSDNMASVSTTASSIGDVNTVAGIATDVSNVADNNTNIMAVASDLTNIDTAATNIAAIIAAPAAATNAATSATNSQKWAEGSDVDVIPLGGQHSSKGWANIAKQYAESIGAALKYKGSVSTYSALPSTGQEIGDMWNVSDTGKNYAWTGTEWDDLAGVVDLSAYRTAAAQDLIDATKQDTLVSGTNIKTVNGNSLLGSGNVDIDALPSQTGQSGKFLTTDGTDASWATVDALPSQTGQAGRYLTTDGTDASWSIPMAGLPLFTHQFVDHLLDDPSYLRADTFSWQSGVVYVSAYQHLVDDIAGVTAENETISGTTITFYRATDGHKVVLADQESNVSAIYTATGIAWYYVLDTDNTRFKLPRSQWAFVGLRDSVGKYVPESLPNINGHMSFGEGFPRCTQLDVSGALTGTRASTDNYAGFASGGGQKLKTITFNASLSSSAYQDNAPVQERATQMYLYFYCGNTVINQTTVDVGEITEELNYKADTDLSNLSNAGKSVIDGAYVAKFYRLALGGSIAGGATTTYDLSSYLPNDGQVYEVWGSMRGSSDTNLTYDIGISTTAMNNAGVLRVVSGYTTTASSGAYVAIVGTGRDLSLVNLNANNVFNIVVIDLFGYRRIGTNA